MAVKCTFGLTSDNIELIEKYLSDFGSSRSTWKDIGNKMGWDGEEAAYWYIRHLRKQIVDLKTEPDND